jgi:hypothetical protein
MNWKEERFHSPFFYKIAREFSKLSEAGADLMTSTVSKEGVKHGYLGCLVDSES